MQDDTLNSIRRKLRSSLRPERYAHSVRVEEESRRLAEKYGADVYVSSLAGLLHDCARDLPEDEVLGLALKSSSLRLTDGLLRNPVLLHGPAGAVLAREKYGVEDLRALQAISVHTLGSTDMTAEDKVVCLADYIEPGRDFPGVDRLRALAEQDLDLALASAMGCTIACLIEDGRDVAVEIVLARNHLISVSGKTNCKAGDPPARELGEIAG